MIFQRNYKVLRSHAIAPKSTIPPKWKYNCKSQQITRRERSLTFCRRGAIHKNTVLKVSQTCRTQKFITLFGSVTTAVKLMHISFASEAPNMVRFDWFSIWLKISWLSPNIARSRVYLLLCGASYFVWLVISITFTRTNITPHIQFYTIYESLSYYSMTVAGQALRLLSLYVICRTQCELALSFGDYTQLQGSQKYNYSKIFKVLFMVYTIMSISHSFIFQYLSADFSKCKNNLIVSIVVILQVIWSICQFVWEGAFLISIHVYIWILLLKYTSIFFSKKHFTVLANWAQFAKSPPCCLNHVSVTW